MKSTKTIQLELKMHSIVLFFFFSWYFYHYSYKIKYANYLYLESPLIMSSNRSLLTWCLHSFTFHSSTPLPVKSILEFTFILISIKRYMLFLFTRTPSAIKPSFASKKQIKWPLLKLKWWNTISIIWNKTLMNANWARKMHLWLCLKEVESEGIGPNMSLRASL